jgi:hypothetical protein
MVPAGCQSISSMGTTESRINGRLPPKQEETNVKTPIITGLALCAALTAFAGGKAQAYVNYPWCAIGESRGLDCVFTSREQCAMDGRGRGFGGQCRRNPFYDPTRGQVIEPASARPRHGTRKSPHV